ncbi:MAG: PaaI family thioesterase [Clostridiales bacterium]|jgi:acyl-CoA thioesterase|nr:PaaI family thioesterase [Clostridiales bacterium]
MEYDVNNIREFFKTDAFAAKLGITIDRASDDEVICSMEITPQHFNAGGAVQGGAIFTLADLTFAVHSNLQLAAGQSDVGMTVGQSCSISFLKSPTGSSMTARSACLSRGRNISVFRISVYDEGGTLCAEMFGNGFTKAKR